MCLRRLSCLSGRIKQSVSCRIMVALVNVRHWELALDVWGPWMAYVTEIRKPKLGRQSYEDNANLSFSPKAIDYVEGIQVASPNSSKS